MSQIKEAMLEVLSTLTGLTEKAVGQKRPLRELLGRADNVTGKPKRYRFGIFTFWYPRKDKDGFCQPFLGIVFDWKTMEDDWEYGDFKTRQPTPAEFDIELSFDEKSAERFVVKMAKQRARKEEKRKKAEGKEAAKDTRKRREASPLAIAAAGVTIGVATD